MHMFYRNVDEWIRKLHLTDTDLCVEKYNSVKEYIDINDIIGVEKSSTGITETANVYVIEKHKTKKWTTKVLKIRSNNEARQLLSDLESKLDNLTSRPRWLLVMICPVAGSQNGEKIFAEKVAPLFRIAKIEVEVIISTCENYMLEYLSTCDFEKFDGIAVCGGDGSFNQCMNAVFKKTQSSAGANINNPDEKLTATTVSIGHIPTGTHNLLAKFCNGCIDVETATLCIIQGSTSRLNMVNLYSNNKWIRGGCVGIIHGNVCEFARYVDNYRWLRTARYAVLLPYYTLFEKMPCFQAELSLLSSCGQISNSLNKWKSFRSKWKLLQKDEESNYQVSETIEDTCLDILLSCQEPYHSESHIGSSKWFTDCALLNVYLRCGRIELLKSYFNRLFLGDSYIHPEFVKERKIVGYKIKVINSNITQYRNIDGKDKTLYPLAVDGEIIELTSPEWEIRLHDSMITVFTTLK